MPANQAKHCDHTKFGCWQEQFYPSSLLIAIVHGVIAKLVPEKEGFLDEKM